MTVIKWQTLKNVAKTGVIRISLGKNPNTGKYEYISKSGFARKSDAKNHAEMVERQIRNGEYIAPSTHTFNYVADEWINHYSRNAKVSSVRAREKAIYHAKQQFGNRSIQTITKRDYQAFVDDISTRFSVRTFYLVICDNASCCHVFIVCHLITFLITL